MEKTDILKQIKTIIQDISPTAKTILYGSQARGTARVGR